MIDILFAGIGWTDIALTLSRIAVGAFFMLSGYHKLFNAERHRVLAEELRGHGNVDQYVNLGDCVSGPLWPCETAELLRRLDWPTVRGNHDRWVTDWPPEKHYPSDAFAFRALDASQLVWLRALPPTRELGDGVFACHGRPDDDDAYLLESIEGARLVPARRTTVAERVRAVASRFVYAHTVISQEPPQPTTRRSSIRAASDSLPMRIRLRPHTFRNPAVRLLATPYFSSMGTERALSTSPSLTIILQRLGARKKTRVPPGRISSPPGMREMVNFASTPNTSRTASNSTATRRSPSACWRKIADTALAFVKRFS
jgi:Calcineurin-like phosphoesterase